MDMCQCIYFHSHRYKNGSLVIALIADEVNDNLHLILEEKVCLFVCTQNTNNLNKNELKGSCLNVMAFRLTGSYAGTLLQFIQSI